MNDSRPLDLNLLRVFDALFRARRVAPAAAAVGLTQPAFSNALARLRRQLDDELFTRTPSGMQPTAHAEHIAPAIADALTRLETHLVRPSAFDPARSDRVFRVAMTDIGEIYFLPSLLAALQREAPQVGIATVRHSVREGALDLREALAGGSVDLAVGWLPDLGAGVFQRRLFEQRYVCLMSARHPLAGARLTQARFLKARHAAVASEGTGHGRVETLMRRLGVRRLVSLQLPHFVAVPHIVAGTDLLVTVPEALAERVAGPFGLVVREHPIALPRFPVSLFWHRRAHQDAGQRWLRERFVALFGRES